MKQRERGITIVSLVITIIVLMLLAGVTIDVLTDHNIIAKTLDAAEKYQNEQNREWDILNKIGNFMDDMSAKDDKDDKENPDEDWDDEHKVNKPKIEGTGLTPVYYNGSRWVELTSSSSEQEWAKWYDYADTSVPGKENQSNWANAKSADGSMWVWIPRYEYKINDSDKSIDIRFIKTSTKKGSAGYITDGSGITRSSDGYIIHPAFIDDRGSSYDNGGWNKELSGFWVAKYQAGFQNGTKDEVAKTTKFSGLKYTTINSICTSNYVHSSLEKDVSEIPLPVFKADTYIYNLISVGDIYQLARKIQEDSMYGLTNIDSHLQKNSEWGAVAYLTHSKYGLNANTSNNKEVTINNYNLKNSVKTQGSTTDSYIYVATSYGNRSQANDIEASSTKNMTGVFDLSGAAYEFTAGFYQGGNASNPQNHSAMATSSTNTSSEYMTLYSANNKVGDAMNETYGWNGDNAKFIASSYPITVRGASLTDGAKGGIFAYGNNAGASFSNFSFRVCLVP